jgi:1,4-alpha-glucan branching enzyme
LRQTPVEPNRSGYLLLVLHAHLPFVRHPEFESFLEERWFFEAITECYIPLLRAFRNLAADLVPFRLTLSLSPTLVAMLQDAVLQQRYLEHMDRLIRLSEREIDRTRGDVQLQPLAEMYRQLFTDAVALFQAYDGDLVRGFRRFQEAGMLELITCGATHGYLPLLRDNLGAVQAQVKVAAQAHEQVFGSPARGIWLPECGYFPGLEERLQAAGFRYFMVDTHGIQNADVAPRHGVYAPLVCPNGVVAFGRDPASSRQVWSAREGYPGDPCYREFHRDIGFDLEPAALAPLFEEGGGRFPSGIKYHRITGHGAETKQPYQPQAARQRADRHAAHFLQQRQQQATFLSGQMDRPALILAPYDAELFGHWWFEGPLWLESLIRKVHAQQELALLTPSDYLRRHPLLQRARPSASSWGEQGYSGFWLNERNAWIYPHLHQAARRMQALTAKYQLEPSGSLIHRALSQAARSLLLAQASDWAFIMKAQTTVEYAERRTREQLSRFHYLDQAVSNGDIDERKLRGLELMDNIFPDIDFRVFLDPEAPASSLGSIDQ